MKKVKDDIQLTKDEQDLFEKPIYPSEDPQNSSAEAKEKKKKKKRTKTVGLTIIIILCVILAGCLGILYYHYDTSLSGVENLKAAEEEQYNTYISTIEGTALPDGWDQADLDALKEEAKKAYDTTLLTTISNAENGDEEAKATLVGVTEPSVQTETEKFTTLFSNLSAYPAELVKMAINDEGLLDFVLAYPDNSGSTGTTEALSESLETIPDLKTYDSRWCYTTYADGIFAETGSAPTAIAEVFSYVAEDPSITPLVVAQWAEIYGYDTEPIRETDDSIFGGAALTWGVNMTPVSAYPATISSSIDSGGNVILALDQNGTTKFVVVTGKDDNGNWIIQNPSSSSAAYTVDPQSIKDTIVKAYSFW